MADFADELAQHIPRLRRYARGLTHDPAWADDLVQDTLERALQRHWLFRFNRNLVSWLFTILHRLYLNDLARQRRGPAGGEDPPEPAAPGNVAEQLDMQRALARLSPDHRAVILLVGLEQLSYTEAAAVLNVPVGTVMSRLTRARAQLRALLSGEPTAGTRPVPLSRIK
jgi:RNA polymerase sigma-70 factor (ECF subfamily)